MTYFSTPETTKEDTLKCPLLVFRKPVALTVYRTSPGSGFSSVNINYQLLQFAAAGAALRTSWATIRLNPIEYISDDLFQHSKDNKEGYL